MVAVDLFAGAGGWDVAARELGFDPLGIELDEWACATRDAAGLRTLRADVAALDPAGFAPVDVLIASPPCTAFSMAGKGKGRDALPAYATAMQHMRAGADVDREWLDDQCGDATAHLVLEPLRWALALEPALIACEQVPTVLPLWRLMGDVLRERGYSTWAGVLEAERFGVPQTRERAILMASRVGVAHPPAPTHQRYVSGEPARHEHTLEGELLSWVSMADALGWGMTERPTHTVTTGGTGSGGGVEVFGSDDVRQVVNRERLAGRWVVHTGTNSMVTSRENGDMLPYERTVDAPAPTIDAKAGGAWKVCPAGDRRSWDDRRVTGQQRVAGESEQRDPRALDEPSYTIRANAGGGSNGVGRCGGVQWTTDRPTTTVNGDPRISEPGHHDENESGSQQRNAVRVTVQEAATLQSFEPDFPWQGSRTAQFRQIGNAVPPLLARAILAALLREQTA